MEYISRSAGLTFPFLWMVNSTSLFYLLLSGLYELLKVRCKIVCRFLVNLGTKSLGIYLIHIFIMMLLKPYFIQISCYGPVCTMIAIFFISLLVVFSVIFFQKVYTVLKY